MGLKLAAGLTLDNGLRPQAIAGVAPTLDYRFARDKREIEAVSLTDKLTYTGGNGTFVGSDGYIQRATTNVPRFDHDPLSRVSEGLLVEGSRENLLLRSEEFDNASWSKTRATISPNSAVAPYGTVTAVKLIDSTAGGSYVYQACNVETGKAYTLSVYAKQAEYTKVIVQFFGSANVNGTTATFDLSSGTFVASAGDGANPLITPAGNGWYRVSFATTAIGTGSSNFGITLFSDVADGTSGIYLWGAQLEAGSTPSTYIPTTASAVTRTADSAVIDGTGVLTGTYTMVAKPEGCAQVSGSTIVLQPGYTAERVMVFPAALSAAQITAIREAM